MNPARPLLQWMESQGAVAPLLFVALFLLGSLLMLWRLEAMSARGFEGTVLGTLVMPYCSGPGNLVFAFLLARRHGPGAEVMTNALVNNVTNMTLILGLPALLWGVRLAPSRKSKSKNAAKAHELNRLALLFTLLAVLFFAARRGRSDAMGGWTCMTGWCWWGCFCSGNAITSSTCSRATCVRTVRSDGGLRWMRCCWRWAPGPCMRAPTGWSTGWSTSRRVVS